MLCIRFQWFYEYCYREEFTIGLVHIQTQSNKIHLKKQYNMVDERGFRYNDVMKKSTLIIQKYLEMCIRHGMRVKIFTKPKDGSVGDAICELVNENKPSFVVIGQRGFGAIKRTLFGSVSEYVLHNSRVPVMIVPPPKK